MVRLPNTRSETPRVRTPFTRHPSLQDVCEVAAEERRKLVYTEKAVDNRPSTAILMTQDGRPIQVIAISSPSTSSTGPVMLHVVSNSPPAVAEVATTTTSDGQLLLEVSFRVSVSEVSLHPAIINPLGLSFLLFSFLSYFKFPIGRRDSRPASLNIGTS